MAPKAFIKACFHLYFVVLVVAALDQSSCIDKVRGILKKGVNLMGGWKAVENPDGDRVVDGIVVSSLVQYNRQSNDVHIYERYEHGNVEAYSQLVNGQNFCVQFIAVSVGCKNKMDPNFCRDGKKVACSVKAFKSFKAKKARIDRKSLACKNVA